MLAGILVIPASAATLYDSGTVTIQQAGYGNYLPTTAGNTIGGGYWKYTSNDGCQLVGKVNYFWGGKSYVIGWDSRWGTLTKVTAPGNDTSGTYRPFGLDCSGFIDWALRNAGLPSDGHWYINTNLTAVSQADALPGDIALYPDASHVGMVVGRNEAGKLLVCHCSSGQNNVVITEFAASGFTVVGRLSYMDS